MSGYELRALVATIVYAAFVLRGRVAVEEDTVGEATDRILDYAAGTKDRV